MHRIDTDGNVGNLFTDGDPAIPQAATIVNDSWLNDVQEELCNAITDAGIGLVKGTQTQLRDAIRSVARALKLGNWTTKSPGVGTNAIRALGSNGAASPRYLAVGDGLSYARSDDGGETWTAATLGASMGDNTIWAVIYAGGQWVMAVGTASGIVSGQLHAAVNTSPDGATWTNRLLLTGSLNNSIGFTGLAYGNGVFIVVGENNALPMVYSSPDGVTWTARTFTGETVPYVSAPLVAFGNGVFAAQADTGSVFTSSDGATWTRHAIAGMSQLTLLRYVNGQFIGCASNGDLWTSPDGVTWTKRTTLALGGDYIQGLLWDGARYIACMSNGKVGDSADLLTWTFRRVPTGGGRALFALLNDTLSNRLFVGGASGYLGASLAYPAQ